MVLFFLVLFIIKLKSQNVLMTNVALFTYLYIWLLVRVNLPKLKTFSRSDVV